MTSRVLTVEGDTLMARVEPAPVWADVPSPGGTQVTVTEAGLVSRYGSRNLAALPVCV